MKRATSDTKPTEIIISLRETVNLIERTVKKNEDKETDFQTLFKSGYLTFLALKQANRSVHRNSNKHAEETKKKREKLTALSLQLQNLQYEKNHFLREVQSCRNFPSTFGELDMIPKEEFFSVAPKDSLPADPSDEHVTMIKRLEFELKKRTELQERLRELEARLKLLTDDNHKREFFLESIREKVDSIFVAAKPMQQFLLPRNKQDEVLEYNLPKPLYVLYNLVLVYKEAIREDDSISIEVVGDRKNAKKNTKSKKSKSPSSKFDEIDVFPLSINLCIDCDKDRQNTLCLTISFVQNLNLVTVSTSRSSRVSDLGVSVIPGTQESASPAATSNSSATPTTMSSTTSGNNPPGSTTPTSQTSGSSQNSLSSINQKLDLPTIHPFPTDPRVLPPQYPPHYSHPTTHAYPFPPPGMFRGVPVFPPHHMPFAIPPHPPGLPHTVSFIPAGQAKFMPAGMLPHVTPGHAVPPPLPHGVSYPSRDGITNSSSQSAPMSAPSTPSPIQSPPSSAPTPVTSTTSTPTSSSTSNSTNSSKMSFEDILVGLVPGDTGEDLPFPVTDAKIKAMKGRAFKWLQLLCGNRGGTNENGKSQMNVENCTGILKDVDKPKLIQLFASIRAHVIAMQTLQTQLDRFAKCKLPPPEFKTTSISAKDSTTLVEWEEKEETKLKKKRRSHRSERNNSRGKHDSVREEGELGAAEEGEVEEGELDSAVIKISSSNSNTSNSSSSGISSSGNSTDDKSLSSSHASNRDDREDEKNSGAFWSAQDGGQLHSRIFAARFKCDKEEYKAKITVSPYYPHVPPTFEIRLSHKLVGHDGYHHHQQPFYTFPPEARTNCDPEALNFPKTAGSPFSLYLKHIQTELNTNSLRLLPIPHNPNDMNYILSYQIAFLKNCLDVLYDLSKDDGSVRKVVKTRRGRDRRIAFE